MAPQEQEASACECETESKGTGRRRGGGAGASLPGVWGSGGARGERDTQTQSCVEHFLLGSVRLMDQGSAGAVLLSPWTVSRCIVVVQSEFGEPGAVTLGFQVCGVVTLQGPTGRL